MGWLIGRYFGFLLLISPIVACGQQRKDDGNIAGSAEVKMMKTDDAIKTDTATFAAGCF